MFSVSCFRRVTSPDPCLNLQYFSCFCLFVLLFLEQDNPIFPGKWVFLPLFHFIIVSLSFFLACFSLPLLVLSFHLFKNLSSFLVFFIFPLLPIFFLAWFLFLWLHEKNNFRLLIRKRFRSSILSFVPCLVMYFEFLFLSCLCFVFSSWVVLFWLNMKVFMFQEDKL